MHKLRIASIIVVLAVVLVAVYWFVFHKQNKTETFVQSGNGSAKLLLLHATWCPHCVQYMKSEAWLTEIPKKIGELKNKVVIQDFEYESNKALVDRYNVSGFPSLVVEKPDGQFTIFEGNRESAEEVAAFVASNI